MFLMKIILLMFWLMM
ncbi:hypothetical protein CFP56_022063 [Quercus suber]|uniref:Uncharacterized protein n=1 Tax=Quercus suber TaxID=58331 RepID=A0AAW0LZG2_QUESU